MKIPQEKRNTYSLSWFQPEAERNAVLAALATEDAAYADPTAALSRRKAFLAYMGEFQHQFPDTRFEIIDVREQHEQSLANWKMTDDSGAIHMPGASRARLTPDGKFKSFTGSF